MSTVDAIGHPTKISGCKSNPARADMVGGYPGSGETGSREQYRGSPSRLPMGRPPTQELGPLRGFGGDPPVQVCGDRIAGAGTNLPVEQPEVNRRITAN